MGILTKEQKEKYLADGAGSCPFCGSYDISGGSIEVDGTLAWQEVDCSACGEEWQDVYKLAWVDTVAELMQTAKPESTEIQP